MKTLADKTLKPVLIVGGAGTALAGVDAFLPRYAVENVQKLEFIPEYTIFVQHWGIMVSLMGVFMIGAAFKQSWRTPILTYSLIEKAFMVFLVFSNFGESFSRGFLAPAIMDSFIVVWTLWYFASSKKVAT